MKAFLRTLAVPAAAILLMTIAGCAHRLPEGRYSASGRNDYALVNNDLIFLHITTPQENPSQLAFWDWAGSYSLAKNGVLKPDMETELWKKWNFYYSFVYEKNAIRVINQRDGSAVANLVLEPARRR